MWLGMMTWTGWSCYPGSYTTPISRILLTPVMKALNISNELSWRKPNVVTRTGRFYCFRMTAGGCPELAVPVVLGIHCTE